MSVDNGGKKRRRPSRRPPLDARHHRAIEMLAGLRVDYADVAKALGISRMTLWRWRQRKDFEKESRKAIARFVAKKCRVTHGKFRLTNAEDIEQYFRIAGIL